LQGHGNANESYTWLVFGAGALGVLYGLAQTAVLMKAGTGNDKMREIAAAIQEGASAYLRRQYTTIAIVGVVILIAAYLLIGPYAAIGFLIGAVLSGAAGYRRHADLGARQRPHRAGGVGKPGQGSEPRLPLGRHHRHVRRRRRVAGRLGLLRLPVLQARP
jgi:hypothetical protein